MRSSESLGPSFITFRTNNSIRLSCLILSPDQTSLFRRHRCEFSKRLSRTNHDVGLSTRNGLFSILQVYQSNISPAVSAHTFSGFLKHGTGAIDANELTAILQSALNRTEIGTGAASNFQNTIAWTNIELFNEVMASIKESPPRCIVEAGLCPVILRHRFAMTGTMMQVSMSHDVIPISVS